MKLTASEEYGLRCLLQLARHGDDASMSITEISQKEGLSIHYVGKMMRLLRQGGFVKSVRGQAGGYALSRPADQIKLSELLAHLGGKLFENDFCDKHSGATGISCVHTSNCSIRSLLSSLQIVVDGFLEKITVRDLFRDERQLNQWMLEDSVADQSDSTH